MHSIIQNKLSFETDLPLLSLVFKEELYLSSHSTLFSLLLDTLQNGISSLGLEVAWSENKKFCTLEYRIGTMAWGLIWLARHSFSLFYIIILCLFIFVEANRVSLHFFDGREVIMLRFFQSARFFSGQWKLESTQHCEKETWWGERLCLW